MLAADRERARAELLEATEKWLAKVAANVARRTAKPLSAAQIGQKVGRGVNRYKVAKHFALEIADNLLRWSRKEDSIAREKALDGVYIITHARAGRHPERGRRRAGVQATGRRRKGVPDAQGP